MRRALALQGDQVGGRPPRATTNLSRGSNANSGSTSRCDEWRAQKCFVNASASDATQSLLRLRVDVGATCEAVTLRDIDFVSLAIVAGESRRGRHNRRVRQMNMLP